MFKALQTYSDGDVVRWIDEPKADGSEPDHPAPILKLAKTDTADTQVANAAAAAPASTTTSNSGGAGTGLGITGIILGLAGLVAGLLAYRKTVTHKASQ
jgi:periplasmic copper chaperone A